MDGRIRDDIEIPHWKNVHRDFPYGTVGLFMGDLKWTSTWPVVHGRNIANADYGVYCLMVRR